MPSLREMLAGPEPVLAPLVLNPLMARLAETAGFKALYLGGGASGYMKVHLEANLNLTEMSQAALDIRHVTSLPLILDGAAAWDHPLHLSPPIGLTEDAGLEIERATCRDK